MTSRPLVIIRSLIFNLCFFTWSMASAVIFAPLFIFSSNASLAAGAPWAKGSLLLARLICGITYEVRGREHIPDLPVIYASKHQSAWDTIVFLILVRHPAYILKRELLRIPLWGWYLWRMRMIAIDRSGKASSMKQMIRDSRAALDAGRSLVIFPEGTRKPVGAVPHYHPGVVALYSQLKVPVVPVALNSGVYWGKNAFLKFSGKIVIEFLPVIGAGLPKEEFSSRLQTAVETASNRLIAEAISKE